MTVIVRHAEISDAEAIQRIHAQPKVVWGTLQLPFPSVELWRNRIANPPEGSHNLVACVESEVVGQLGLWIYPGLPRRRHVGGLGMAVHDEWQQRGIGTALMEAAISLADRWLNLMRLELDVYADNEPAVKLYSKFGFAIEGTSRSYAFRDGEYVDAYRMARFRRSAIGCSDNPQRVAHRQRR